MHVAPSVWPCPSQLLLITQAASNRRWRRAVTAERLRAAIPTDLLLADDDDAAVLNMLSARGWEPLQVLSDQWAFTSFLKFYIQVIRLTVFLRYF